MDSAEIIVPPPYEGLSDPERRKLIDGKVIHPLEEAGKEILKAYDENAYRGYILHPMPPEMHTNEKNKDILYGLLEKYPKRFAQSFLNQHPTILDFNKKIHLQPFPRQVPDVVTDLVKLLVGNDEVYQSVYGFKVVTKDVYLIEPSYSQAYVVVYLLPSGSLDKLEPTFTSHFSSYPEAIDFFKFNQKLGPIVFSASGDSHIKRDLSEKGLLSQYYDPEHNYALPNSQIPQFHEWPGERLVRLAAERTIK